MRRLSTITALTISSLTFVWCCPPAVADTTNAVFASQNPAGANSVASFVQNPRTGNLSFVGEYATGGTGDPSIQANQSHALASNGSHLFVTNAGDDSISVFTIKRGGKLSLKRTYPSAGSNPVSLAVIGSRLLVVNQGSGEGLKGNIRAFQIRRSGSLSRIRSAHFDYLASDVPVEVIVNSRNSFFSVARSGANALDFFKLNNDGTIVRTDTVAGVQDPLGGVMKSSPQTIALYTLPDEAQPGVTSVYVSGEGKAQYQHQEIREDLQDPCWAAIHRDQRRLWLSSFKTRALSLYTISDNGAMTAVSDYITHTTGPGSVDITTDKAGAFLFRLRAYPAPTGSGPIQPYVDTLKIQGGSSRNAGLSLTDESALPSSWSSSAPTGILAVQVNTN